MNLFTGKMEKIASGDYTQKTFREIYKGLPEAEKAPKTKFIEEIADLCSVSTQTVRMWIQGTQRPDACKQKIIANELGIEQKLLFPTDK
jgi:transcriptional regulator with XRE-family HTH domain